MYMEKYSSKEVNVTDINSEKETDEFDFLQSGNSIIDADKGGNLSFSFKKVEGREHGDYRNECVRRLHDPNLLQKLVANKHKEGNLHEFVLLIEQLSTGKLPSNNIVLLLLLDRVRFQKHGNTVGMHYRKVSKLFWSIVYRLCKGVGL